MEENKNLTEKEIRAKEKEAKKLQKVKRIFNKRYTKKSLNKKIYKKLFVPADKKFIEGFIVSKIDEKNNKEYFEFDKTKIADKKQLKEINRIAKEISKQKGRISFLPILASFACVFVLLLFLYFFRNILAKKIVVGGSEAAFGAKCEVSLVDFDLLNTRFRIQGYRVANKNSPMRNLFEIKNIDFYFNLLELSRGKFVAENMAIEGFTWDTERSSSGALPKKKPKKKGKPNPVVALIQKEADKIKAGVSVDRGLKAVQDQVDPKKILEREKAKFKIPKVTEEILNSVDPMTQKWMKAKDDVETQTKKTVEVAKKIAEIDIQKIDNPAQLEAIIKVIYEAKQTGEKDFRLAENLSKEITADAKFVESLAKKANFAVKNDFDYVKNLAAKIKSINIDMGKKIVSQLINTFVVNTLGKYYPYFVQAMDYAKSSQNKPKTKEELTLAERSRAMERLAGKTFIFGKNAMPTFAIKNISLSGHHPKEEFFKLAANAAGISNDADKLGVPISIGVKTEHNKLSETADGIIDLRSYTDELVDTLFTFNGLELEIPSSAEGVPSLNGILKTSGGVKVSKKNDVVISSDLQINNSVLTVQDFEPLFVSEIYRNILSEIKKIDAKLTVTITEGNNFDIAVDSSVDKQIASALNKEFNRQVEKLKKELIKQGNIWLDSQKEIYKKEISQFNSVANNTKKIIDNIKNYEKLLDSKKKTVEKRIKDLAKAKIKQATDEATKEAEEKVKDLFKGLF